MHARIFLLLSLLPLIGLASCRYDAPLKVETPADSAQATTTFELAGPGGAALMVPVYLNGHGPYPFVLDTGATLTCVAEALADSLGLPERAGQYGFGFGVQETGNVRLVSLDSLRLGATKAYDLTACTLDLRRLEQAGLRIDGLLGLNFLKSFRVTLKSAIIRSI